MTREQMMAYRKQIVDHLEQCKELVKPRERFFKKYHSRLFWKGRLKSIFYVAADLFRIS